ncbi:ribosome recycling factor [Natronospira proteinivora]|uniref:Ribosome-recycling factor n=2 Tax=Natronospira proteinivora TaxID=1807133 RepID=A0ABT1G5P7_9GAMM|nr:ribosome recycling factor [Natronospira proteinivora]MCP1726620.1 ribosome recycling factor [Natronospira proteinivora]
MIEDLKKDAAERMKKSVVSLREELSRMRTGRANTSLLEPIKVQYYGAPTPLKQVANVGIEDARTLVVTPWEKDMVPVIEKAIMSANLGLSPVTAGTVIRVPLPPLTEERRREMIKLAKAEAENARVAVRNIRRDILSDIKDLLKEKDITEDDEHKAADDIQKVTDKYVGEIDEVVANKEKELLEV